MAQGARVRRRQFLGMTSAAAGYAVLMHAGFAKAQSLAGKQIRLIVPFPAGGPTDIVARPIAQMLGDALKSVVVVDNRGGAGGSIGAEAVARSAPDGQTLLMGTVGTQAINPRSVPEIALRRRPRFHADRAGRDGAGGDRRASVAADQRSCRSGGARQAHARQAQLRLRRCRHARAPHGRDVQERRPASTSSMSPTRAARRP